MSFKDSCLKKKIQIANRCFVDILHMYFHKRLSSCHSQTNVGLLTTINLGCLFSSFSAPSVKQGQYMPIHRPLKTSENAVRSTGPNAAFASHPFVHCYRTLPVWSRNNWFALFWEREFEREKERENCTSNFDIGTVFCFCFLNLIYGWPGPSVRLKVNSAVFLEHWSADLKYLFKIWKQITGFMSTSQIEHKRFPTSDWQKKKKKESALL